MAGQPKDSLLENCCWNKKYLIASMRSMISGNKLLYKLENSDVYTLAQAYFCLGEDLLVSVG